MLACVWQGIGASALGLGVLSFFVWMIYDTYKDHTYTRDNEVYAGLQVQMDDLRWQIDWLKNIEQRPGA